MSDSPADLYVEVVLDHARWPRHKGPPEYASGHADGFNPLCGDRVEVWVDSAGGVVRDVGFEGEGCAISTASASIMTEAIAGHGVGEAREAIHRFLRAVTAEPDDAEEGALDPALTALAQIRRLPMRVKCATMAWRAAERALDEAERANHANDDQSAQDDPA